ncbi:MAG: NADH-quinone oxidoreductase subunit N [Candidatus Rokubacteria bacterium]|nr:NADH-quinone oxidoreductase subunit N [Candidatus Rokubacteria bacterium]
MMPLAVPTVTLLPLAPVLVLTATAALLLLLDLLPPRDRKAHLGFVGLGGVVVMLVVTLSLWGNPRRAFDGMVVLDDYALFFDVTIAFATGLVLLLSLDYLPRNRAETGEYYALVCFSATGMVLLASAADLILIFLAVELMSLSLYVLAGFFSGRLSSSESAMKYFLLGAFATGFLLYGIALIYGATGTTNLERIAAATASLGRAPLLVIGFALLLVGFGFKISSAPFHMWVPDVYQGAPTSVTALIATGSKAAALAALLRVLLSALRAAQPDWVTLVWVAAVLTMTVGNVVAIAQSNLKRMLAYSAVAHIGYMLVGVVAGGSLGTGGVLFYLLVYTFTTVGAFGVILLLERGGQEAVNLADYAGLATRHPVLALTLSVFLLSLIGIPPTAGFVGKFYLFAAAIRAGYLWLVVIAVLNSAVAAYYYLRLIVYMYMRDPEGLPTAYAPSLAGNLALGLAVWGVLQFGVMPAPLFDRARAAVAPLLR